MEIRQLRYFCAIAREGTFVKAAEAEGVSQPSLSQQIRKLEDELGVPLFDRLGRGLKLTSYGLSLYERAQDILRRTAEAEREIQSLSQGVSGTLRVGCIPTILPYFLAPNLSGFNAGYPEADIQIVERRTSRLVEQMQAGELDLAVIALPVEGDDLLVRELFREPLLAALPPSHPLVGRGAVSLTALESEKMLLLREGHCLRNDVLTGCRQSQVRFLNLFESDNLASIFALVSAGAGSSIVPQMAAAAAGGCKLAPIQEPVVRRIGYARVKGHFVSPLQKVFTDWLKTCAPQSD